MVEDDAAHAALLRSLEARGTATTEVPVLCEGDLGRLRAFETRRVSTTGGLSPRSLDVLRGLERGLSSSAIGVELGVSGATVKTHLTRMYRQLGATDRATAVVIGYRRGILDGAE